LNYACNLLDEFVEDDNNINHKGDGEDISPTMELDENFVVNATTFNFENVDLYVI